MQSAAAAPLEWRIDDALVGYEDALAAMEQRVAAIRAGTAPELVWLLQHPDLYTAGSSARVEDLLQPGRLPVFQAGRGGQYTYHGPGQRVAYLMLDLRRRSNDVHRFVHGVESWLIRTLARFGLQGETRPDRVGVWVAGENGHEDKIAAIGIRVRHGITFHGASINVDPDLSQFQGIVPCGIQGHGVTSLAAKGVDVTMAEVDAALRAEFDSVFG